MDRRDLLKAMTAGATVAAMPFNFEVPISFFTKSGADASKNRRIGGIISTEKVDRQGEVILQHGLDFSDFLRNGWFNDNHKQGTTDVIGYPESVQRFEKGDRLPDGKIAKSNGTWAEGYLLDTPKGNEIWKLGQSLRGTGRSLGYSVEGSIQKRLGKSRNVIAQAKVRNVAVTHCPVNDDSRLMTLAKSLDVISRSDPDELIRALSMGASVGGAPLGARTGEGAGQVLALESLDRKVKGIEDDEEEDGVTKSLTAGAAIDWVLARQPSWSVADAGRFVDITKALKRGGRL